MDSIVAYLVAAMIGWVPLHAHLPSESVDDARARYESIARDVVSVAFDESESPVFSGPEGRTQTALLMLSVASYESGYRKVVDDGRRLGDHSHSYCLMQVRVGTGVTREGWSGHDLVTDRRLCFRAAPAHPAKLVRRVPRARRRRSPERLRDGALLRGRRRSRDRASGGRAHGAKLTFRRRRPPRTAERRSRAALPLPVESATVIGAGGSERRRADTTGSADAEPRWRTRQSSAAT